MRNISKLKLKLANKLDELQHKQGKSGYNYLIAKSFSIDHLLYMVAIEEEELNYFLGVK